MHKPLNKPDLSGIARLHYELAESCPIMGSCNLHLDQDQSSWDMHYALEFGLCYAGIEQRLFTNGFALDVKPGDAWFCGMWEPHGRKVIKTPCKVIVIKIWPPLIAQMRFADAADFNAMALFMAPASHRPRIPERLKGKMLIYAKRLKEILAADLPHHTFKLRAVVTEILLQIYECWPEADSWKRRAPSTDFSQINQALQLVFDSHDFVSTQVAARTCGMNRHSFGALFKAWMNIDFSDFAAKYRLSQATKQMLGTREPIKLIALQWGFTDISHFHRAFKKHYGIPPHEYRGHFLGKRSGK